MNYPTIAQLVQRSKESAKTHIPASLSAERSAKGIKMSGTLLITCIDPRCTPEHIFKLKPQEVIVHRNGGGHARRALSDICALDVLLLGGLDEIAVIHHTDCGALRFTNEKVRKLMKDRLDCNHDDIKDMDFGPIEDLEKSVRDDLIFLRQSPLIRKELKDKVRGFVFDITSGELSEIN
ncbi:carbonic anhydrase [Xylogone sp. PMI_703]|nr:carbonic anhydrase [Xylogone sp. PMI_703]